MSTEKLEAMRLFFEELDTSSIKSLIASYLVQVDKQDHQVSPSNQSVTWTSPEAFDGDLF